MNQQARGALPEVLCRIADDPLVGQLSRSRRSSDSNGDHGLRRTNHSFRKCRRGNVRELTLSWGSHPAPPMAEPFNKIRSGTIPIVTKMLLPRSSVREQFADLDLFDLVQLAEVVRVCRRSTSISAAGRTLFASSRTNKAQPNDADRLRKYLTRFGLSWAQICPAR